MTGSAGLCTVCGNHAPWIISETAALRENYCCSKCKASLRYRNQASAIVNYFGLGIHATLRDLIRDERFSQSAVFEIVLRGPFIKYFSKWTKYTQASRLLDKPAGQTKHGVKSEDLTKISFDDSSFDLIVSSEVMQHVFKFEKAFAELFRILKPGGYHIFTIPLTWPISESTVKRATETRGSVEHHLPPRFQRGGNDIPSLVCTEFGLDLLDLLTELGYKAWFSRPSMAEHPQYRDAVVVAQRPGAMKARNGGKK